MYAHLYNICNDQQGERTKILVTSAVEHIDRQCIMKTGCEARKSNPSSDEY